ncbi:MAG: alkyl hydroperoxide reductase subunit C [Coriobacteriales bacterium]|jgi:peroxiredoxin
MTMIGKEIGDFTVNAYKNGEFRKVSKSDVLGHWSIFFFYPADFTFICPTELEDLAMNYDRFQNEGAEIYSVSCDTEFVHKAWHDESPRVQKVQFPMLADPSHVLVTDFDVLREGQGVADRGEFIVDPQGIIQVYNINADGIGRNSEELLRLLQAAKFVAESGGAVCPAKWHPGADTFTPGIGLVGM